MCIQTRIERAIAQKAALDAQILKLESLEIKTAPVKSLLTELLADYSDVAPEDLASVWQEILAIGQKFGLSVEPLAADELRQWEATNAKNERLKAELAKEKQNEDLYQEALTENTEAAPEPEYEPDEAYDTIESILEANGFFQPDADIPPDWNASELYENYRGWDIFYSVPNGGIVAIGLNNSKTNQFWDSSTEYIQEIDGNTFPECLGDYDEIVAWTKQLIDQVVAATPVESSEVPGQLALEFPSLETEHEAVLTGGEYNAVVEEELALDDDKPTELQKLLINNCNFTFKELGVSAVIESVFTEQEVEIDGSEDEDDDDSAIEEIEEARITVTDSTGKSREFFESAQTFVYQRHPDNVEQAALGYAQHFLNELKKDAEIKGKIARWNADTTLTSNQAISELIETSPGVIAQRVLNAVTEPAKPETETNFEAMGFTVAVHPQYTGENLVGATFRFFSQTFKGADGSPKLVFSTSQTAVEIGDRTWKICACDLIRDWRDKEAARLEKLANPHATEEDKFIELVKLTPAVGYIKRRDNGELISAYVAFGNRDTAGEKTKTLAKPRAQKWKEFWHSSFESCGWKVEEPRKVKRMQSEPGAKQVFAYEVKITGKFSIGQLQKLAEEDFSLLPNEIAAKSAEPATTQSVAIYHVIANGYQLASGTEEEMRLRFEQELRTFGSKGRIAINLVNVNTGEDVEAYYYDDFAFIQAQDFDEANPEYFAVHTPTKTNFRVYRSIVSGANWVNSIYPHNPLSTKEAAAVDGVRRKLKADQEVNVSPVLSTKLPANPGLIYSVRIDSLEKAKGTKEEMTLYFEEQLEKLGGPHKSVVLLRDFEVKEKFDVAEFTFTEVDDFDPDNPEYEVQHLPTQKSFKTEQVMSGDWRYDINSIFSSNTVKPTRESAAADAVRKMLATGI